METLFLCSVLLLPLESCCFESAWNIHYHELGTERAISLIQVCVIPIMEMLFIHQLRKSRFRVLCWHPGVKPRTNHEVATPSTDEVMVVFAKKKHIGLVNYYQFTSVYSNIDQFRFFLFFLLKQKNKTAFLTY